MMKIKLLCALVLISTGLMAAEPQMPEQMMRGKNSQYQDGFRDGFREAVRMMNGGGNNGGGNSIRGIEVSRATWGSSRGRCDFTDKLARYANGKSSYSFKTGNNWCGDPSGGYVKSASIEYYCKGKLRRLYVNEERSGTLSCY